MSSPNELVGDPDRFLTQVRRWFESLTTLCAGAPYRPVQGGAQNAINIFIVILDRFLTQVRRCAGAQNVFNIIIVILALTVSLHFLNTACAGTPNSYYLVSQISTGGNTDKTEKVTRRVSTMGSDESGAVLWEELGTAISIPNISLPIPDEGESIEVRVASEKEAMPEIPVKLDLKIDRTIQLSDGPAVICKVNAQGAAAAGVEFAQLKDAGIEGAVIKGEGMFVYNAKTMVPIAGRLHLEREVVYALWKEEAGDDGRQILDVAWSRTP